METLTIINQNGSRYIDSREVAEVIGKQHKNLLRDITGYIGHMKNANGLKIEPVDFFLESSYLDVKGETRPCYLITKMGCEMVANKLTGEKGILFTAAYVAKFNEMEAVERATIAALRAPRLGEYNAAMRLIVKAMRNAGASPERIVSFLKTIYEPLGIKVETDFNASAPRTYSAYQIAELLDVYSMNGKPHNQAVACILNEHIAIEKGHKTAITSEYGDFMCVRYDDYALEAVSDWLLENGYPNEIFGDGRTYHVIYL